MRLFFDNKKFTLIELLMIIVILTVIMGSSVSYLSQMQSLRAASNIKGAAALIRTHLRFAQTQSMNDDEAKWGIIFSTDSYQLQRQVASETATHPDLPGLNNSIQSLEGFYVSISADEFMFDNFGLLDGAETIMFTDSGEQVTIDEVSGYIR